MPRQSQSRTGRGQEIAGLYRRGRVRIATYDWGIEMNTLTETWIRIENDLGLSFYNRQPVAIDYGVGTEVWDTEGKRYLDFTSGWGVACLGHAHPVVVEALTSQARRLTQNPNSGFTYSPARAKLLAALARILPDGLVGTYFVNSRAEANDLAICAQSVSCAKKKAYS